MAAKFPFSLWKKSIIGVLVVVSIVILVFSLLIDNILANKLSEKLKAAILQGTGHLYSIGFSKAEIHLFRGSAELYDIVLTPNTAIYGKMQQIGSAPAYLYELRVKRLEVYGAHPFELYFKKKLDIAHILLNSPDLKVSKYKFKEIKQKDQRTLYQQLSKTLQMIQVSQIDLNNIHLTYNDNTGTKPTISELKEMNLKATDLLIDSTTQNDTSRFLYCKDITTQLYHYSGASADGLYHYKVRSVTLSTQTSHLTVGGAEVLPLATNNFFAKSKGDRFTFHVDSVDLDHFDYRTFGSRQDFNVKKILVNKAFLEVYGKPNGKIKVTDRVSTFPNWAIRRIKTKFDIDTLELKNIDVIYRENGKSSGETGAVRFMGTNGKILNITNDGPRLKKNNICTIGLTSYFMGKGKLDVSFYFNLNDKSYNYDYNGHLGPMELGSINPAIEPLGMVEVNSGRIKSLSFDMHSTQEVSKGKLTLLYNKLKVTVLKHDPEKGIKKNAVTSLVANTFIIKQDNPDEGTTVPRTANVVFIRPLNFPFFKTIWQTLLTGIKACAGVGAVEKSANMKPKSEQEQKKQDKAFKKAEKKKEKEEKKFQKKLREKGS